MDKFENFTEFCNNSYSKKMIESFSYFANYIISVLDSISKDFRQYNSGSDDTAAQQFDTQKYLAPLDNISGMIQRSSKFFDVIMSEAPNERCINSKQYLDSFAAECQNIFAGKYNISIGYCPDFSFNAVKRFLDLIILIFIRKVCSSAGFLGSSKSSSPSFELSADVKNSVPEITINTNVNLLPRSYNSIGTFDFFENFFDEISGLLIQKLNAEAEFSSSHMTIKFRNTKVGLASQDNSANLNTFKTEFKSAGRSDFYGMLYDL